jgi:signal transduction histidine kinase
MYLQALSLLLALLLVTGSAPGSAVNGADVSQPKNVLLLYSHRIPLPVIADWDRGIRDALTGGLPNGVKVYTEFLDLYRFEDSDYEAGLADLLQRKYEHVKIDLVMPVYTQAFKFAVKHRDDIFPNAPLVFCSIPEEIANQGISAPGVTGVVFRLDFEGTIQAVRELFPDAHRLLVVYGASSDNMSFRRMAEPVLRGHEKQFEIEYSEGEPMPQLVERVAKLDAKSAVLMLAYDKDVHDNDFTTAGVVERISSNSNVPVFGLYDTLLGRGIVGGSLVSPEGQGTLAGEIGVRVLKGESASEISIAGRDMHQLMFDARQLDRFGIAESSLPKGSIVRFRSISAWRRYRHYYLIGLAVILAQSAVIAAFIVNLLKRLRTERLLAASRTESRELAGRLISAQEDERKRLARELHDDLSQRLAASAIEAGKLEQHADAPSQSREAAKRLKDELISVSDDVHQLSRQIHPAILDDLGLPDALRSECDRFNERNGMTVRYCCPDHPDKLPKDVRLCLYRVAQEALWNAVKHSESKFADVSLSWDDEAVYLEVQDFGRGFDPNQQSSHSGLGLASMTERVRLANGRLTIKSSPGAGTAINATLPLSEEI